MRYYKMIYYTTNKYKPKIIRRKTIGNTCKTKYIVYEKC